MQVRAIELGIYPGGGEYSQRRYPATANHPRAGQVFDFADDDIPVDKDGLPLLPDWVEPVDPSLLTKALRSPGVPQSVRAKERHPAAPPTPGEALSPPKSKGRKGRKGGATGSQQVI